MTRRFRRLAVLSVAATVVLGLLLALRPLSASRAFAIWILLLAAIALAELVRAARDVDAANVRAARRFEEALRPRRSEPRRPAELDQAERELVLGAASAAYAHRRLLPHLRAVAAARLAVRHGVDLERRPETAAALLGDEAWELLRPDRPEPEDPNAPGVPLPRIEAFLARVESL